MKVAFLLLLMFGLATDAATARDKRGRDHGHRRPPPIIVGRPPAVYSSRRHGTVISGPHGTVVSGRHGTIIVAEPPRRHPTVIVTRPRW